MEGDNVDTGPLDDAVAVDQQEAPDKDLVSAKDRAHFLHSMPLLGTLVDEAEI